MDDEPIAWMNVTDKAITTGTAGPGTAAITLADLMAAIRSVPEDPIAAYMRERGFDPKRGGVMYLPESLRTEFLFPPDYIKFSSAIDRPMLGVPRINDTVQK